MDLVRRPGGRRRPRGARVRVPLLAARAPARPGRPAGVRRDRAAPRRDVRHLALAPSYNTVMARLAIVPELETELDRLYELPLDEFTPPRNELAARLKKAGQGDAAARVKELKKPTVAVWTANQLARREQDEVARLVEAGGRPPAAQGEGLRGGGPGRGCAGSRGRGA